MTPPDLLPFQSIFSKGCPDESDRKGGVRQQLERSPRMKSMAEVDRRLARLVNTGKSSGGWIRRTIALLKVKTKMRNIKGRLVTLV